MINLNPSPTGGSGVFGSVPGPVALPQPYQTTGKVLPNLQGLSTGSSNALVSELSGQLSPDTLASIQNAGAAYGVETGMPGSGLVKNYDLDAAAQASMSQQSQGMSNYQKLITPSARYLTVAPTTQAQLAETNALNAAAPNPTLAGLANIGSTIGGLGWAYGLNNMGGGGSSSSNAGQFIQNDSTAMANDPTLTSSDTIGGGTQF